MERKKQSKIQFNYEKRRFLNTSNELSDKKPDFMILGIPIEYASTQSRGDSSEAPDIIRYLSDELGYMTETGVDLTNIKIFDGGNLQIDNPEHILSPESHKLNEEMNSIITKKIGKYISDKFTEIGWNSKNKETIPIILGGNHYITIPIFNNLFNNSEIINDETLLISLDAHLDFYDNWEGNKYAHCTVIRRIYDLFSNGSENILLFGVRDIDVEEFNSAKELGLKYYTMHQLHKSGLSIVNFLNYLIEDPSLYNVIHKKNGEYKDIYLSLDLDVLDPSIAEATGYPIPGGFSYRELYDLLEWLSNRFPIKVIDIVEYAPNLDTPNFITGFTLTRIVLELVSMIYKKEQRRK